MAEVQWIKITTDIFSNKKIRQIDCLPDRDGIIVIWFKLITLAGEINENGNLIFTHELPYTEQMLAAHFNRPLTTVQMALSIFQKFGMIEIIDDIIHLSNWEKYQNIDGLEKIREQNRKRVAKHREKKRLELLEDKESECNEGNVTSNVTSNVTVMEGNAIEKDIEEDKEKEIEKDKSRKTKRFVPPTVEEVADYCNERMNSIDAESFVDYYTARGWLIGKNPMKDWKAAVRTWERNGYSNNKPKQTQNDRLGWIDGIDYTAI